MIDPFAVLTYEMRQQNQRLAQRMSLVMLALVPVVVAVQYYLRSIGVM